ncbi:hypothetical protein K7X08_002984 [Anisodus acutangulus]|uniref:Uncharacterized protein n=1 Tax=Anisodus acutangulus TaxID=402998 RepID=A0A9Q1MEJ3_9SOLA|nr:hypothetical protein K7X08_002984 [Anisodus acutangulus]
MASRRRELINEMKKEKNALDLKMNMIFLEYDLLSEWMERPSCSACIEEQQGLLEKLIEEMEQLKKEYEKLSNSLNFMKTIPDKK